MELKKKRKKFSFREAVGLCESLNLPVVEEVVGEVVGEVEVGVEVEVEVEVDNSHIFRENGEYNRRENGFVHLLVITFPMTEVLVQILSPRDFVNLYYLTCKAIKDNNNVCINHIVADHCQKLKENTFWGLWDIQQELKLAHDKQLFVTNFIKCWQIETLKQQPQLSKRQIKKQIKKTLKKKEKIRQRQLKELREEYRKQEQEKWTSLLDPDQIRSNYNHFINSKPPEEEKEDPKFLFDFNESLDEGFDDDYDDFDNDEGFNDDYDDFDNDEGFNDFI